MSQQRTPEWYEMRRGRFTASDIYKLLGVKGLGLTGETLAFEKAVEIVYGIEEEGFVSYEMQRGIELEPMAFSKFQDIMSYDFIDVNECVFFPYGENAGASPDGLVGNDAILEIKCPNRNKFFRIIADGVKAIDQNYIYQMQMQMLCTNSVKAYFFNYGVFSGKEYWHTLVIQRDEKVQELIKSRIKEATKIRDEFVEYLIKNQQF